MGEKEGEKQSKKGKKRKREREVEEEVLLPPLDEGECQDGTDTEYDLADVLACPKKITISDTGEKKIDAVYEKMTKTSRGRSCWASTNNKKRTFIYWHKDEWKVGYDFGSENSIANVEDTGKLPC